MKQVERYYRTRVAPGLAALRRRVNEAARSGRARLARLPRRASLDGPRRRVKLAASRLRAGLSALRRRFGPAALRRAFALAVLRPGLALAAAGRRVASWLERRRAAIAAVARFDRILAVAAGAGFATALLSDADSSVRVLLGVLAVLNLGAAWSLRGSTAGLDRLGRWARGLASGAAPSGAAPSLPGSAPTGLASLADSLGAIRVRTDRLIAEYGRVVQEGGHEIARLTATSQELSAAGEELAATVQELSDDTGIKADAVQRAAESGELVAAAAREVAVGLAEAARSNASMREVAEAQQAAMVESARSVDAFTRDVRSAVDGMRDLAAAAERTAGFVGTIRSITKQTNILALNAAIEAARAGETGHGFTVVADEVRKLADQAAVAATEIQLVVRESNRAADRLGRMLGGCLQTGEVVALGVGEAAQGFEAVVQQTRSSADHMFVVQAGMEEIERQIDINTAALEELSAEITELAAATQEMSATAEEMAAGLGELVDATEQLGGLLGPAATAGDSADDHSWRRTHVGGEERSGEADDLRTHERVHA